MLHRDLQRCAWQTLYVDYDVSGVNGLAVVGAYREDPRASSEAAGFNSRAAARPAGELDTCVTGAPGKRMKLRRD